METARFKYMYVLVHCFLILLCSNHVYSQRQFHPPISDSLCYRIDGFEEYYKVLLKEYTPSERELKFYARGEEDYKEVWRETFEASCANKLSGKYLNDINRKIQVANGWLCKSDWNNDCKKQLLINVEKGWEACSIRYRGDTRKGETSVIAQPLYYERKNNARKQIKAYVISIEAIGNRKPFKQEASEVNIDFFDIDVLKLGISEEDLNKHKLNCQYHTNIDKPEPAKKKGKPIKKEKGSGSIIREFTSTKCNYNIYYIDTTEGVVDCKLMKLYGTVTPTNPIEITTESGKSCLIRVNIVGSPCKGTYSEYNIIAKKNSNYIDRKQILLNKANCT